MKRLPKYSMGKMHHKRSQCDGFDMKKISSRLQQTGYPALPNGLYKNRFVCVFV